MICSYECTFCVTCVKNTLENACPNCGGGFVLRPIRPKTVRRAGISIIHQPSSAKRVHTKYNNEELKELSAIVKHIKPEDR